MTQTSIPRAGDPATPPGAAAIDATGIRRVFGETVALDGVSVRVEPGEIYGFLGPNGAGKTTLVRVLTTLLGATEGRATVAGADVARETEAVRYRIGVALQEASLDPGQTGRELLRLQAALFALPKAVAVARIAELIELVDLGDAIDRRVETYSGGMKRRLDLALALVHDPEVLFLDEPTTGLDPVSRRQIWDEVRRLNREQGLTVFLTTQYLEEADELADRVGIIAKGRIVAEGTPDELKRTIGRDVVVAQVEGDVAVARAAIEALDDVESVRVAGDELTAVVSDGPAAVPGIAVALNDTAGVRVTQLSFRRPSLDDVFLEVTGARIAGAGGDDASHDQHTPHNAYPNARAGGSPR
ncbi:MAG TPA: ATP-binding cassette domain-containing protein [Candidatus Limnocylindrales bacterium]|nr:ATP-binding cassette domain-containing protein [Candidatus Limnocylindrales bacterium]